MEYTTYASRLRFLDADDLDDGVVDYDGLDVRGPEGDTIGTVDGFIVDAEAGRAYYIVVDSGGWFTSRRFLLPIGHSTLTPDRRALSVEVTRKALEQFPEFDEHRFRQFSDEDLHAFERRLAAACCPRETVEEVSLPARTYDMRPHYDQPAWWSRASYPRERLRPVDVRPVKMRE